MSNQSTWFTGKAIKDRRKQLGMTQQELANKCGYKTKISIAKIEAGEFSNIPAERRDKIARALRIPEASLFIHLIYDEKVDKPKTLVQIGENRRIYLRPTTRYQEDDTEYTICDCYWGVADMTFEIRDRELELIMSQLESAFDKALNEALSRSIEWYPEPDYDNPDLEKE